MNRMMLKRVPATEREKEREMKITSANHVWLSTAASKTKDRIIEVHVSASPTARVTR